MIKPFVYIECDYKGCGCFNLKNGEPFDEEYFSAEELSLLQEWVSSNYGALIRCWQQASNNIN